MLPLSDVPVIYWKGNLRLDRAGGTMCPMKRGTFLLEERNSFDGIAVKTNIVLLLERVTEVFVPFPAPVPKESIYMKEGECMGKNTIKLSVSVTKGRGNLNHNNREFLTNNVDADRVKDNITYTKQSIEEAYEMCFGKAVEEYDLKQKRNDRKIGSSKDYLEKIRHSGNNEKEFYEIVVQVGNMYDNPVGTKLGEEAKKILDDYMLTFAERNPNLYVFNAVMHLDEKTPHLHIDYIPIARGYKQGMKARNSLDKALKEMGVEVEGKVNRHNNRNKCWQENEKDVIEKIMQKHNIERTADRGLHREHLTVGQYKAVVEQVRNEVKCMPVKIPEKQMPLSSTKVIVEKNDLIKLEKRAGLSMTHEKAAKELIKENTSGISQLKELNSDAARDREAAKEALRQARNELTIARMEKNNYKAKYQEQLELNERFEEMKKQKHAYLKQVMSLEKDNADLRKEIKDLKDGFNEKIGALKDALELAYAYMGKVVMAIKTFVYSENDYRSSLTTKQKNLISALSEYASTRAKNNGFDDIADEMNGYYGISEGIQNYLPKEHKRDRGLSR